MNEKMLSNSVVRRTRYKKTQKRRFRVETISYFYIKLTFINNVTNY